jgi:threonine synthase
LPSTAGRGRTGLGETAGVNYISTRGGAPPLRFEDILLEGLAPDGGLYVPAEFPRLSRAELAAMRTMSYPDLATALLARFADDVHELPEIVARTYTREAFGTDEIAPLSSLAGLAPELRLLHISNGPTLAFKDMAMQLLGGLFEHVLRQRGRELNILGATSGDTGSSAEHAMRGRQGIRVFMLSPKGRMTPFQTAQMYTLLDENIHNLAVDGVFDDCQDIVKTVSADAEFKASFQVGTVNSINWARVAAQVVYYFRGCFAATRSEDEEVSFAVPSGNFGNIYAGYVARRMGLPVRRLVLATNENDVLDEFFRRGVYRPRVGPEVHPTSSPSMDISRASNFERFVHAFVGGDGEKVAALWTRLGKEGSFDLSADDFAARVEAEGFVSGRSTHADRVATIRRVWETCGVLVDPHTADGIKVALEHLEPGVPMVCLETALPAKFAATIREAVGFDPPRPPSTEGLETREQRFETVAADAEEVKRYIAAHVPRRSLSG